MGSGVILIIGMASITVAAGVTGKILEGLGKTTEAAYLDLATKSGLALTAVGGFVKFIGTLAKLG